jgi:hypothetical protein
MTVAAWVLLQARREISRRAAGADAAPPWTINGGRNDSADETPESKPIARAGALRDATPRSLRGRAGTP